MNCVYFYKDTRIGNELQLNDFIHETLPLYKDFKDLVFKHKKQAETLKIIGQAKSDAASVRKQLKQWAISHKDATQYGEDGYVMDLNRPAIGVTKFIEQFKDPATGDRIAPEFISANYWNRIREDWKQGIEHHKEILGNVDFSKQYDEAEYNNWQEQVIKYWQAQSKLGSAMHGVFELMFQKVNDTYNFKRYQLGEISASQLFEDFKKMQSLTGEYIYQSLDNQGEGAQAFKQFAQMLGKGVDFGNQLVSQLGEDTEFFPELDIRARIPETTIEDANTGRKSQIDTIIGSIDLLAVDKDGHVHIFDYKTSTKHYSEYAKAKQRRYTLQLGIYDRILRKYGLQALEGGVNIVPLQIKGFKQEDNGTYSFESIDYSIEPDSSKIHTTDLTQKLLNDNSIVSALDLSIPQTGSIEITTNNLVDSVMQGIHKWLPSYQAQKGLIDAELDELIRKGTNDYTPTKSGDIEFRLNGIKSLVTVKATDPDAKIKLREQAKEKLIEITTIKNKATKKFITSIKNAQESGGTFKFESDVNNRHGEDSFWLQSKMQKYCDSKYEIFDLPQLHDLGIVLIKDKDTNAYTVLKITGSYLQHKIDLGKNRTTLLGKTRTDAQENSNQGTLALEANTGNAEAMEVMLALQAINTSDGALTIDHVEVINPYYQQAVPVTNAQLLYNYKNLMQDTNVLNGETNKFQTGKIKMLTEAEQAYWRIKEIQARNDLEMDSGLIPPQHEWEAMSKDILFDKLSEIKDFLEDNYPELVSGGIQTRQAEQNTLQYRTYHQIMQALLELKGINIQQQLKDSKKWIEDFKHILTKGWAGLMVDNPGNHTAQAVNQINKHIANAYQNIRDESNRRKELLHEKLNALKKELGFSTAAGMVGSQSSLYDGMIEERNGDLYFVDPKTLSGARREFLETALEMINADRYPQEADRFKDWKESYDERYYQVPVLEASVAEQINHDGFLGYVKGVLKSWKISEGKFNPKDLYSRMTDVIKSVIDPDEGFDGKIAENVFRVANVFKKTNEDALTRKKVIDSIGLDHLERNVEKIVLHHNQQYIQSKHMAREMPLLKACTMALAQMGSEVNADGYNFNEILDYIEKYIKVTINGESIVDENIEPLANGIGKVRKIASFMALGLNPIQYTRQRLEGIWKTGMLVAVKPDGTQKFTMANVKKAFKEVNSEMFNKTGKPTVHSSLNAVYAINDMDSRQYANRIAQDHGILTHMDDFAFHFVSRPDFYNRMTIFEAQMIADGSYDAHIMEGTKLIYDWTKDKRFAEYAAIYDKNIPPTQMTETQKQAYTKYLSMARQLVIEEARNADGSAFQIGQPLPRAYSNKEASAMKNIADQMYGYYNHEDKSLFGMTWLGGMYMQMKTYWSAKKNQLIGPGGIKLMGHYEPYVEPKVDEQGNAILDENGQQIMEEMYYAKNPDTGEVDINYKDPVTGKAFVSADNELCSGVKVEQWKGQWQEGVVVSVCNLLGNAASKDENGNFKGLRAAWEEAWYNEDENMRIAFRSNLKRTAMEFLIFLTVGCAMAEFLSDWDDDQEKAFNKDKGDMGKAMNYFSSHLLYKTVDGSALDFQLLKSVGEGLVEWQPFSLAQVGRVLNNGWDVLTGDKSLINASAGSISAVRTFKPILQCWAYDAV